jgi:Tol biopolymer transport system component
MRRIVRIILLVGLLLAAGLALALVWQTPRLVAVAPADGTNSVAASTAIQVTFSRPMQPESVLSRFSIQPAVNGEFAWQGNTLTFTPSQPWPAGVTVQAQLAAGALSQGFLAQPLNRDQHWSFTVRQPRLVFLYPSNGPANIYYQEPATGEFRNLTNTISGVQDFDLDANGAAIFYSVRNTRGGSDIYRMALPRQEAATQGGAPTPVPDPPQLVVECLQALCRAPAISPRGDYLAYEREALPQAGQSGLPQVWVLPLSSAGSAASPFVAGVPEHQTILPVWSLQGQLVFYDSTDMAYMLYDPIQGAIDRFANQTGQPGAWQTDGRAFLAPEIIFLSPGTAVVPGLQRLADSHLMLHNWQADDNRDLTQEEGIEDAAPAFAPDGARLAFARKFLDPQRWTPGRQLWLMRLAEGVARPLTADPLYNHFDFAWSPDSSQLAYVRFNQSTLTDPPEIWTTNPLTGQTQRIIIGGYAPQWIP